METSSADRYDPGTKVWTTVFCVLVAAVIDWQAAVNPVRGFHPTPPNRGWWMVGLIIALVPPAAWLLGRLLARRYAGAVVWVVALAAIFAVDTFVWNWAQGKL